MRRTKSHIGLIILLILAIVIGIIIFVVVSNSSEEEVEEDTNTTEATVERKTIVNTLSSSGSVSSALTEKIELHATYYFQEIKVDKNSVIEKGATILTYTNGTSLIAPYNCIITEMSIPESGEQCTNSHYITIQSTEMLTMSLNVKEDELNSVFVGQEVNVTVDALNDKEYKGYVTKIGNTATYSSSGSKFEVTVEFENDGNVLIGMSATCNVILEKAENAIVVPSEAITTENKKKQVTIKKDDGTTENIVVETGISNDAYTEILSDNLQVGQTVIIEKEESSNNMFERGDKMDFDGQMMEPPSGGAGDGMGSMDGNGPPSNSGNANGK